MEDLEELGYSVEEVESMHKNSSDFKAFCYQLMKVYGNDKNKLNNVLVATGLYMREIVHYANLYKNETRIDYSNPKVVQKRKEHYLNTVYNPNNVKLIRDLLDIKLEDVSKLVDYFTRNPNLYKNAKNYEGVIINIYSDSYKTKLMDFKRRLVAYRDYLMSQRALQASHQKALKEEKINQDAKKLYQIILSDDEVTSFTDVAEKFNISKKYLTSLIRILRTTMYDDSITLFDKARQILKENKKVYLKQYVHAILKVLPLINDGILVGDVKRSFDIFDCYTYFGKKFSKIIEALRNEFADLSQQDVEQYQAIIELKKIILKYNLKTSDYGDADNSDEEYKNEFIKRAFENTLEINQKAINGRLVRGSGHIVTENEKKIIFQVLEEYHIPFNSEMYMLATKRLNNGSLELITPDTIDDYLESDDTKKGTK